MFKILNSLEHNSQIYTFHIKILTNNLLTMQNLSIRYPHLYTTSNCTQCLTTEDIAHILLCTKNTPNIQQSLIDIINNTLTSLKISTITAQTLLNILLHFTLNTSNSQYHYILLSITGTFPLTIYTNIKNILQKQTDSLLTNLSNNLLKWLYIDIWS